MSATFRFLHCADVHLDSPIRGIERYPGAPVEAVRGATRRAFENLVELALAEAVQFVLIAGDLYDGDWRDYNTGLYFTSQVARLAQANIPVFIIAGNHDAASELTRRLRLPEHVHLFSTSGAQTHRLDELGVAIHGQGFATRAVTDNLAQGYPAAQPGLFNIGMLHTSLGGRPGHENYAPCNLEDLLGKRYDYWALGHVHRREVVHEQPWIVFPGNVQGRHARETGSKGCELVSVEDGRVRTSEHCSLDVVRWTRCAVDAGGAEHVDEVLDRAAQALRDTLDAQTSDLVIARTVIEGASSANAALRARSEYVVNQCRALAAGISPDRLWLEKIEIRTRPLLDLHEALARDDAIGGLLRAIHELEPDDGEVQQLSAEVDSLLTRLRADLGHDEGDFDLGTPDQLREVLDDVKAMLLEGLQSGGLTDDTA